MPSAWISITLAVIKWCIKSCHSFDIFVDEGLHDLLRVFLKASSRYGPNIDIMESLPHPTSVARVASESFEQVLSTIKGELAQIKEQGFSIADQQIQKEVEDCLHNLDLAGAIIVTDRSSEVYYAFKHCDHIYCINHLLNNVVEKSFRDVKELEDMKLQATELVKYLQIFLENVNLKSSLQSDYPTRWNSIFIA